jgi:hypothetical protein
MKLLRALFVLPLVVAVPSIAFAQEDPEPDEAPGASSTPPETPADVPPPQPSSPPPSAKGTTSHIYVQGDDGTGHHHRPVASGLVYRRGKYMLRDAEGIFEISPGALLQTDWYGFAGVGVPDYQKSDGSGLKSNFAIRRMRLELSGYILQKWYFVISGESANGGSFLPLNDYIGVEASRMLRVQVGQMRIPLMMDIVTSIRWSDFMERSLSTRLLGAPLTRDIGAMVWGGTEKSAVWYALGYFGGEGQNRASTDNRGDVVGRLVLRPLWGAAGAIKSMHIGVSGRWGRRDPNYVQYDAPSMSTPGGYTFFNSLYGSGAGKTHVRPSGDQSAVAAELFIPGCCFDLRAEVLGVRDGRREVLDSSTTNNTERSGTLKSWSYYVQATFWPYGPARPNGPPGNYNALSEPPFPRARSLALAVRWEQIFARYDSIDRSTTDSGALVDGVRRGGLDQNTTTIRVDAIQFAASYWATRHLRVIAEWSSYYFPGDPDVARVAAPENQAVAPGARASTNDPSVHWFHEMSARVQITF